MPTADTRTSRLSRREALALLGLGGEMAAGGRVAAGQTRPTFPRGSIVRTVLKDVPPDGLGPGHALMHEHLNVRDLNPKQLLDPAGRTTEAIIEELKAAKREGLSCIVDAATSRRSDEQITRLKRIATESGVNVVMAGGYFTANSYPAAVIKMSEDEIADHLAQDAKSQGWGAFGEIGSSMEMHPDERKMHRAVAKAHLKTGLPIFTHTPHESCATCALDQMEIYESLRVNPQKLCIGHIADILDDPKAETLKSIAKRGAFVGFDDVAHFIPSAPKATDAMRVTMILALLDAGYADNILLSSDFAHQDCLKSCWGAGYSTVTTIFVPKLRYAGVDETIIRKILVDNSRRFLAFTPPAA